MVDMAFFREISHVFFERTHVSTTLLYHYCGIRDREYFEQLLDSILFVAQRMAEGRRGQNAY